MNIELDKNYKSGAKILKLIEYVLLYTKCFNTIKISLFARLLISSNGSFFEILADPSRND